MCSVIMVEHVQKWPAVVLGLFTMTSEDSTTFIFSGIQSLTGGGMDNMHFL
uniref:Uncharacterized protein n=1 Tax=Nelumbo nucifera TaxID=4432 RepID=A0A822YHP7_NELNU|nr:TPA_asm: hypothetical protein HUJ06_010888 [Nelumbo nucifera]